MTGTPSGAVPTAEPTPSGTASVRAETTFLVDHCVAHVEPLQTRSGSAGELAEAPDSDRLVLLTLDGAGWATGGETFAGC